MAIIMFLLLLLVTILLRFRFSDNRKSLILLRSPFLAGVVLFSLSLISCFTAQNISELFCRDIGFVFINLFMPIPVIWFALLIISSSKLKTPINGLFITPWISDLRVDINPRYIHTFPSKASINIIAEKLTEDIKLLSDYPPYMTITLQSHLLTTKLREEIKKNLLNKKIPFIMEERETPLCDIMVLNLRYGGKTCYRLFSCKKHPNGFKVHKNGSTLTILINRRPDYLSP